jgi:hypothetical protein
VIEGLHLGRSARAVARARAARHPAQVTYRASLVHCDRGRPPHRASSSGCDRRWIGLALLTPLVSRTSIAGIARARSRWQVQDGGSVADQARGELVPAGGARPGRGRAEVRGDVERFPHEVVSAAAGAGCVTFGGGGS